MRLTYLGPLDVAPRPGRADRNHSAVTPVYASRSVAPRPGRADRNNAGAVWVPASDQVAPRPGRADRNRRYFGMEILDHSSRPARGVRIETAHPR